MHSELPAYCFNSSFPVSPAKTMQFDRHYLLYSAKGVLRIEAEDRYWILPPSRALWIPAKTAIEIEISQPVECCSILFDLDFINPVFSRCQVLALPNVLKEMILHSRKWGPDCTEFDAYAKHFFQSIAHLCAELKDLPSELWTPKGQSKKIKQALNYTQKNLSGPITFTDIASHTAMTERSLARAFGTETDMTWSQLLRHMRMIQAIELLSNLDLQMLTISLDVGYQSLSSFNRAFKEFTSLTPSEFRREYYL
ncbi:MAG: hypothetical protein OFPI_20530 [Osedax symbiont Rs2]|nr:MAG: hypothetical protein OFPI_20530 [Osedax symbiont Rs2]